MRIEFLVMTAQILSGLSMLSRATLFQGPADLPTSWNRLGVVLVRYHQGRYDYVRTQGQRLRIWCELRNSGSELRQVRQTMPGLKGSGGPDPVVVWDSSKASQSESSISPVVFLGCAGRI